MHNQLHHPRRRRASRPGTVYLLVLVTVGIVTVLIMASLYAATVRRASVETAVNASLARAQAESGIELGLHLAQNSMTWRQNVSAAAVRAPLIMGAGSFGVYAGDPADADLDNNLTDPVTLQAFGWGVNTRQIVKVTLDPDWTPMSCLTMALCAGGSIGLNTGSTLRCISSIGSNELVVANSATVNPNVYAVGTMTGSTYNGSRTTITTAFEMPSDPASHYTPFGTSIPVASISGRRIDKQVMSPARNPYGSTNAQGIYIIECGGNDLRIRDSRIVGTLVVLDSSGVIIEGSVFMEPAVAGYPVLITNNDLTFSGVATDLTETSAGVNFNPASTPYKGQSDSDTSDSYPSILAGLVYVGDDLIVTASCSAAIDGAIIVNDDVGVDTSGNLTLFYRTTVNAPPGFVSGNGFVIRNGSWARVVE